MRAAPQEVADERAMTVVPHELMFQEAASFAARRHASQKRKDGATPYVAHPFRVAMTVRHVFGVEDVVAICAALLHDTVEDTQTDHDDLLQHFGREVADAVSCLTKDKRLPEARREEEFFARIAAGSWQTRVVKLADAFDNVSDAHDAKMLAKAIGKARKAISVCGSEPQVRRAAEALSRLLASKEPGGPPA